MPGLLKMKLPTRQKAYDSVKYLCTVKFLDDSEAISVTYQRNTKGRFLIDHACSSIDLLEKDYFGLKYTDADKQECWLDPLKTIHSQLKGLSNPMLYFHVKYYPADPSVVKEEITRYQLFLQVRKDLEDGRLICSLKDALVLSAYIVQAELGDCIEVLPPPTPQHQAPSSSPSSPPSLTSPSPPPSSSSLPWKYVNLVKLSPSMKEYEEEVSSLHRTFRGMKPAEAEFKFLKKASVLTSYGMDPYIVDDMRGTQMYLTVTPHGIISFVDNKPTNSYHWRSIRKISFDGKMFYIKLNNDDCNDNKEDEPGSKIFSKMVSFNKTNQPHQTVGYKCLSTSSCKQLWKNAVAHKFFYTLKSSDEAPKVISSGGLFSRGSKFRYSGQCLSEVYRSSANIDRPEPKFTRYLSSLRPTPTTIMRSMTLPQKWRTINNADDVNVGPMPTSTSATSLTTITTVSTTTSAQQQQQPKKYTSDSALETVDSNKTDKQQHHQQSPSSSSTTRMKDHNFQQQHNNNNVNPILIAGNVECDFNASFRSADGSDVITTCEVIEISDDGEDDDEDDGAGGGHDGVSRNGMHSKIHKSADKINKDEILKINKKFEELYLNGGKVENKVIMNPNFIKCTAPPIKKFLVDPDNNLYEITEVFNKAGRSFVNKPLFNKSPLTHPTTTTATNSVTKTTTLSHSPPTIVCQNVDFDRTYVSKTTSKTTTSTTATLPSIAFEPPSVTLTTTFINIATPSQQINSVPKHRTTTTPKQTTTNHATTATTTTVSALRETPIHHIMVDENWVTETKGMRSSDGWIVEEGVKRMRCNDNSYDTGYMSSGSEAVNEYDVDADDKLKHDDNEIHNSINKLEKPEAKFGGIRKSLLNLLSFVSPLSKAVDGSNDDRAYADGNMVDKADEVVAKGDGIVAKGGGMVCDDGDATPVNPIDVAESFANVGSASSITSTSADDTYNLPMDILSVTMQSTITVTSAITTSTSSTITPPPLTTTTTSSTETSSSTTTTTTTTTSKTTTDMAPQATNYPQPDAEKISISSTTTSSTSSPLSFPKMHSSATPAPPPPTPAETPSYPSSSTNETTHQPPSTTTHQTVNELTTQHQPTTRQPLTPTSQTSTSPENNYERIKEIRKLLQENKDRIQEIRDTIDNEIRKPLSCYSVSSDNIDIKKQIWTEYIVTSSSSSSSNRITNPTIHNYYHNQLSTGSDSAIGTGSHGDFADDGVINFTQSSAIPKHISISTNRFEWCGEDGQNSGGVGVVINNSIYSDVDDLGDQGVCSEYIPDGVEAPVEIDGDVGEGGGDHEFTCGGFVNAINAIIHGGGVVGGGNEGMDVIRVVDGCEELMDGIEATATENYVPSRIGHEAIVYPSSHLPTSSLFIQPSLASSFHQSSTPSSSFAYQIPSHQQQVGMELNDYKSPSSTLATYLTIQQIQQHSHQEHLQQQQQQHPQHLQQQHPQHLQQHPQPQEQQEQQEQQKDGDQPEREKPAFQVHPSNISSLIIPPSSFILQTSLESKDGSKNYDALDASNEIISSDVALPTTNEPIMQTNPIESKVSAEVAEEREPVRGTMHYLGRGVCITLTSILLSLILFIVFVIIIFECFKDEKYINDYIIIREFKSSVYDLVRQYILEMFYRHILRLW